MRAPVRVRAMRRAACAMPRLPSGGDNDDAGVDLSRSEAEYRENGPFSSNSLDTVLYSSGDSGAQRETDLRFRQAPGRRALSSPCTCNSTESQDINN
eukprot:scaffold29012_cov68-Phaeocystis_antarctica.AAC.6